MHHFDKSGCGCHEHHQLSHHSGGHCRASGMPHRHFMSKEETIKHLEEYLQQLQSEAKGVEEYINKLKTEK